MDTTDPDIRFDATGLCSHCQACDLDTARPHARDPARNAQRLERLVADARAASGRRDHDCVIGLSGGLDSSYLAYLAVREWGLRPLAVHLDNGWDSRIAVKNIQGVVRALDLDLVTHVIDWEEFRDLQRAYLFASVLDLETITDHAIAAILYRVAREHGIRHVLFGTNLATERILPRRWGFNNRDLTNIEAIHRRHGTRPLATFPRLPLRERRSLERRGTVIPLDPLNWVRYVRADAARQLSRELGWIDYGGKHCESLITRFFQGHFLPEKFGIDKRRAHLSTLINEGQLDRERALEDLATPPYDPAELERDRDYVARKLGLSLAELTRIVATPPRSHFAYATDLESKLFYHVYPRVGPLYRRLRGRAERAIPPALLRSLRQRVLPGIR